MFGCYRRGDANDPDIYAAAVAAVLSRYPLEIVEYITDPRTGLPGNNTWLPSVAEVKEACVKRRNYLDRLNDYDRLFAGRTAVTPLPFDKGRPGRNASVHVHNDAPQYAAMLEWIKTADAADWKFDATGKLFVSPAALPGGWRPRLGNRNGK
jgi:hypothetical protein